MCARYVWSSPLSRLVEEFKLEQALLDLKPNFNAAPSQEVPLIINAGTNQLVRGKWGFVPSWAKDPQSAKKLINARSETVAGKPSFKAAFKNQRCLFVADGFYEWRKTNQGKQPMYFHLKTRRPFGMAGLYNFRVAPNGDKQITGAIITTQANEIVAPVHNRMPVIISKNEQELWLNPKISDNDALLPLLRPYATEEMAAYQVSPKMNSPRYNSPENIQKILVKNI